jgi:predicted mannosyl-3-phosphoglycerate phosphatase (HAD superfamily)
VQSWLPYITGSGGALVILALWVYAFFAGKIHSDRDYVKLEADNDSLRAANDKLAEALALERQRSNDAATAGSVTVQLIGALTTLATEHRAAERRDHAGAAAIADAGALPVPGLTGKDLAS